MHKFGVVLCFSLYNYTFPIVLLLLFPCNKLVYIVYERLNMSANFFQHLLARSLYLFGRKYCSGVAIARPLKIQYWSVKMMRLFSITVAYTNTRFAPGSRSQFTFQSV